jgi:hypothetical protein
MKPYDIAPQDRQVKNCTIYWAKNILENNAEIIYNNFSCYLCLHITVIERVWQIP